jgi:hypothetical protein
MSVTADDPTLLTFGVGAWGSLNDPQIPIAQAGTFNSPGPFVYHWSINHCPANISDLDCDPPFVTVSDTTSNPITLPRQPRYANGTRVTIVAEIREDVPNGKTGADTVLYIITPTPHGTFLNFNCTDDRQRTIGYPFVDPVQQQYSRNPCTGARILKPQ